MTDVRIRAVEPDDLDDIVAIFGCPGVISGTLQLPYRSTEDIRERMLQRSPDLYHLAAEVDGRVAGTLGLHLERGPRRRHAASFGMAVHDDFQNRGIGSSLIAAMLELADNWLGLRRIELQVHADNDRAVHLYEKFGFTIEGTLREFALRNGVYVDAYTMARLRAIPAS